MATCHSLERGDAVRLSAGEYNSFVVRIWSRGAGVIQGQITHVATRETTRFKNPEQMMAFISAHLGPRVEQWTSEQTTEGRT